MLRIALKLTFLFGIALASGICLNAQTTHGAIKGRVTDSFGAVIPNATVFLRRPSTKEGFTIYRQTTTDGEGEYAFAGLPFGLYEVQVKVEWVPREFTRRLELTSMEPTKLDVIFSFAPCSDEPDAPVVNKLTEAEHSEIIRILVDVLIGDRERKVILSPINFSPDWLSSQQRLRTSILERSAIQELTEKNGPLNYYQFTKPIQRGRCVAISVINSYTVKGQLENANMAGGEDLYEFRRVDGKWSWLLISSVIS